MNQTHTLPRVTETPRKSTVRIAVSRPVSLYDNLQRVGESTPNGSSMGSVSMSNLPQQQLPQQQQPEVRTPTMANCLSTTVPQNIAGVNIAGRHTPTRNSLRHSRMIVMSRTGKVSKKYHPPVLRRHHLATALSALQVVLGVAVSSLAVWLLVWAPNLRTRDIPYWSGLPLMLSGIMGLLLLCCCRKDYPGMPLGIWIFSFKASSVCMAVVAAVSCFCASVFSLLHLIFLAYMSCEPAHVLNATCVCRSLRNATDLVKEGKVYHYVDLNCPEVSNILSILLIGSCAANGIGGILSTWYVFLHWTSRYTYLYSEVQTSESKPVVISNKMGNRSAWK